MTRHRWLGACLLCVSLAVVSRAEGPPRHVPLPPGPNSSDPEAALAEQLATLKNYGSLPDQAKNISLRDFKLIQDFVSKNPQKATDPKEVSRLVHDILGKDLSAGDQKLIESMLKNMSPDTLKGSDPSTTKAPDKTEPPTSPDPATKTPEPSNPTTQPTPPSPTASSISDEEQKEQEALARDLAQFAKQFEGLAQSMPESPAMQKLLQDLTEFQANVGNAASGAPSGDGPSLAKIARSIRDLNGWIKLDENSMNHITPPRIGPFPTVSPPISPNQPFPQLLPRFGPMVPPGFGSLPGPRSVATFLAVVAIILLLGWRLREFLPGAAADTESAWQLGAWPVEPSKISSRADLVRAFDYLSLQRFGQAALSWNHRTVAVRLGGGDAELTRAAERLASAYERARYAPETAPLDEAALNEARSDLCYLAGTVSA